ncbi:hypothetical protein D3C85_1628400 [compost metagenome]
MSDRLSNSAPNALWLCVSRATRPSMPSRIMAMKIATAACSKFWFIACTMA